MKKSSKLILATFNTSASGKSLIHIDGDTMYVVNSNVAEMLRKGEIDEVTFAAGADLMDRNEPTKVAFKTMQVTDFTESAATRLQRASAIVTAYDAIDTDKLTKALELAKTITI